MVEGVFNATRSAVKSAEPDYRELWFALMRSRWQALGVIGASPGPSARRVAEGLAKVGGLFRGKRLQVVNTEEIDLASAAEIVNQLMMSAIEAEATGGLSPTTPSDQKILVLGPIQANPMVIPLAMVLDAILVVVDEGESRLQEVQQILDAVDRKRIVGALIVKARG